MTQLTPRLVRLGDALERAARADLGHAPSRRRRPLIAIAAAVAVLSGGAAIASELIGGGDVSNGMIGGAAIFEGTHPTCTVVQQDVEYRCVLDKAPFPEVTDFKGVKEPSVDATKHINGGCEGLSADGLTWECYLGQAAVGRIISEGVLGEYAPEPGHG